MNEQPSDNGASIDIAAQLAAAIGLHQRGQLSEARAIYDRILRVNPDHADALHLLGVMAYQQRRLGDAIELFSRAIALSPGSAVFYVNRAIVFHELKQLDAAIADYGQAIAINPAYIEAYTNRGAALRERTQFGAAIADYDKAISLKPDFAAAYNNRGVARRELKQLDAAIADFGKAIAIEPDYVEAYNNRGNALQDLKQLAAAIADYDKAIALKRDYADAYYNRGNALHELKQLDGAVADYGRAIAIRPDYAAAFYNRGNALRDLRKLDAAVADYEKAIALKPDYMEAYYNQGNVLRELRKFDAAIALYDKAISIKPDSAAAYNNRGIARQEPQQLDAAMADFDRAIAIAPDYAEAYANKALIFLLQGDLATGFELYEWRLKIGRSDEMPQRFSQPLWLGVEPLRDKKILLHSEQGLGDTIQFCRYAALVAKAGAEVLLEVPRQLIGLLQSLAGASRIIAQGDPLPDFDYHCPLMSLPLAFKTVLDTIPDPTPYLHADPAQARAWQERIGQRKKLKVGVVWNGGFRPDRGWDVNERRNIRLDMFARALNTIDADFFSLQKGDPAESEIRGREIEYWPRGNFHNFAAELKDFVDTAALIANLDLVVTVDTSTAHLAAALGKPTWILNRFDTDWRWLLDRDDSPWYRSVRLYRQDESQSWEPVLRRLAADLAKLAEEQRADG